MSLDIKNVRVPTPRVRAELVLSCLESNGPLNEYIIAGAISENDGVAILRSKQAAQAMTLADATIPGAVIHLKCLGLKNPGVDTIVVTPATFADGATLTFDAKDEEAVLIWVTTNGWTLRSGNATVA